LALAAGWDRDDGTYWKQEEEEESQKKVLVGPGAPVQQVEGGTAGLVGYKRG
jgi:hypothetical protein